MRGDLELTGEIRHCLTVYIVAADEPITLRDRRVQGIQAIKVVAIDDDRLGKTNTAMRNVCV